MVLEKHEDQLDRKREKTKRVRNEVVHRQGGEKYTAKKLKKGRKANRIGHISRKNCLRKHIIAGKREGSIEVTGRLGGRRKQLLDDLKGTRGCWKLQEEGLDRSL